MIKIRGTLATETILLALLLVSVAVPLNLKLGGVLTVYTFDVALYLLYGVWLAQLARGSAPLPKLRVLDVAALVMLGWLVMSALLGTNLLLSIDAVLYYVRMYLIYLYVANNLRTAGHVRNFVRMLLALIVIEGIVCIIQYATKTNFGAIPDFVGSQVHQIRIASGEDAGLSGLLFRARGTLGYDTPLGHWFELLLPIPVSLWAVSKKRSEQIAYIGVIALGFAGLVLTFARGAWMGLATATIVLFLLLCRRMRVTRRYLLALGVVAATLGLVVLLLWTPIQARLFSEKAIFASVNWRGRLNQAAIEMILADPLSGMGPGSFSEQAQQSATAQALFSKRTNIKAHNVYLVVASESGLVGLELFLAFLAAAGVTLYHVQVGAQGFGGDVGRGLLAGFVGVLLHGFIDWGLLMYMVFPLFWALLGLAASLRTWRAAKPL
jgi:O-antigen ligase